MTRQFPWPQPGTGLSLAGGLTQLNARTASPLMLPLGGWAKCWT